MFNLKSLRFSNVCLAILFLSSIAVDAKAQDSPFIESEYELLFDENRYEQGEGSDNWGMTCANENGRDYLFANYGDGYGITNVPAGSQSPGNSQYTSFGIVRFFGSPISMQTQKTSLTRQIQTEMNMP